MSTLANVTLRCLESSGEWCVMNHREKGLASFCYSYPFLGDALDAFRLRLTGTGTDQYGLYLVAESAGVTE